MLVYANPELRQAYEETPVRASPRIVGAQAGINAEQLPVCHLVVVQELIEFIVILGFKESLQAA